MGTPRSPGAGVRLSQAEQKEKLVALVLAGMTVRAAAAKLEVKERSAYDWYQAALRKAYEDGKGDREAALGRELATLDLLQKSLMPQALRGHTQSAKVVLEILDRRSKYLGLDEATKVQLEFGRVEQALAEVVQVLEGEAVPDVVPLRMLTA